MEDESRRRVAGVRHTAELKVEARRREIRADHQSILCVLVPRVEDVSNALIAAEASFNAQLRTGLGQDAGV